MLYQRKIVIEPNSGTSSDDSQLSFTRHFSNTMSSKNPWDRVFALGKVFSILKGMQGVNMTNVGEKLVKGVYKKK